MVDVPFKWAYEEAWKVFKSYRHTDDDKHYPFLASFPLIGSAWSMRWYKALNKQVTLPDECAFLEVSE
jgi:IS4 transposase